MNEIDPSILTRRSLRSLNSGLRGNKVVPLKSIVDEALSLVAPEERSVEAVLVVDRLKAWTAPSSPLRAVAGAAAKASGSLKSDSCFSGEDGDSSLLNGRPQKHRDVPYSEAVAKASPVCEPTSVDSEDPLFILYTSGSTGKPKGVLHTSAGYLLGASMTHEHTFDHREGDVFWCTADCGWITGHTCKVHLFMLIP